MTDLFERFLQMQTMAALRLFGVEASAPLKKAEGAAEAPPPMEKTVLNTLDSPLGKNETERSRAIERRRMEAWVNDKVSIAKARGEPLMEVVTLTPILAGVLLDRNPDNRHLSVDTVVKFARDISAGNWALNGEPIILSNTGLLNDGQQRCAAVIEAQRAIRVVLVIGPERETRLTVDQGRVRTVADYLGMNQVENCHVLAATATMVWQYKTLGRLSRYSRERPTKHETLHVAQHYKGIGDSVRSIPVKGSLLLGGRSFLAFCHFTLSSKSAAAADIFMDKLLSGADLEARDPILYARNRLLASKSGLSLNDRAELVFRAWNAHRRKETPRTLPILGGELPTISA